MFLERGCSLSLTSGDFTAATISAASASFSTSGEKRLNITSQFVSRILNANNIFAYNIDYADAPGSVTATLSLSVPEVHSSTGQPVGDVSAGTLTLYDSSGKILNSVSTPATHIEGIFNEGFYRYYGASIDVATMTTDITDCVGLAYYLYDAVYTGDRSTLCLSQPGVTVYATGIPAVL